MQPGCRAFITFRLQMSSSKSESRIHWDFSSVGADTDVKLSFAQKESRWACTEETGTPTSPPPVDGLCPAFSGPQCKSCDRVSLEHAGSRACPRISHCF